MQKRIGIETSGIGIRSLEAYFKLLHAELPPELPRQQKDWQADTYDAPHGFLWVGPNGSWRATFVLNSVLTDLTRIRPKVKSVLYKEDENGTNRSPIL